MPDLEEMIKKRVVYSIAGMEQIQVHKNIQRIYRPLCDGGKL